MFEELALLFSTKKVPEAGESVGPIEVCCSDVPFGVWEVGSRAQVRKAAHPLETRQVL